MSALGAGGVGAWYAHVVTQAAARMEYLAYRELEAASSEKHEFLRGEVFAMAGGTPEHAALTAALSGELRSALAGRPCRVYSSDLRVRVQETDLATYPDVTVVCGKLETAKDDPHAATNPVLLVEVLSETSEAYDRGEKAAHYRRIPSLREYVLVSQRTRRIEVFRKNDRGHFELFEFGPTERAELASVGASFSVDDVYRDPLAS